jgi:predicted homoserine dehydrogenase-like protein
VVWPVEQGQVLTWADVEIAETSVANCLQREMEQRVAAG